MLRLGFCHTICSPASVFPHFLVMYWYRCSAASDRSSRDWFVTIITKITGLTKHVSDCRCPIFLAEPEGAEGLPGDWLASVQRDLRACIIEGCDRSRSIVPDCGSIFHCSSSIPGLRMGWDFEVLCGFRLFLLLECHGFLGRY